MAEHQQALSRTVAALSNTKSFEYCVSKKIAELTQVVHVLFTKTHEREVEIEALTDAYEHEIELVQQDARGIIGRLEKEVRNLGLQLQLATQRSASSDIEWQAKLNDTEQQLQAEKEECQKLRDLLTGSEKNLHMVRGDSEHELAKVKQELAKVKQDLANSRRELSEQQLTLARCQGDKEATMRATVEQQQKRERAECDLEKVKQLLDSATKSNEELVLRIKKLDSELRTLKATKLQPEAVVKSQDNSREMAEELERLRREVQRYRMEISNRESTYNKVFTDKRPLVVGGTHKTSATSVHSEGSRTIASASLAKERVGHLPPLSRDNASTQRVPHRKPPNRASLSASTTLS